MTKKELTAAVVEKAGVEIKKADAQKVVDALLEVVVDELKAGNKVTLNGVGILEAVKKPARTGRNPRTGETTQIAASVAAKFKASKALKDALNA
ncbi:MAG: HU family DNA-binding protein [Lachnospiraceae bacterium]|nr:HU family DNA-binding protein [Lachnospiraceae bacterium]